MTEGEGEEDSGTASCAGYCCTRVVFGSMSTMPARRSPGTLIGRSALIERKPGLPVGGAEVLGARTDEPVVPVLLHHVGGPAGAAGEREDRRVEVGRNAEHVIRRRRIEIDVAVEPLLLADELLDPPRHRVPPVVAGRLREVAGHAPQVSRPRVLGRVDAVS